MQSLKEKIMQLSKNNELRLKLRNLANVLKMVKQSPSTKNINMLEYTIENLTSKDTNCEEAIWEEVKPSRLN